MNKRWSYIRFLDEMVAQSQREFLILKGEIATIQQKHNTHL